MPMALNVPVTVRAVAQFALDLHRKRPALDEVAGVRVAEALASGHTTLDVVQKMHRFFAVNEHRYLQERQLFHTEENSATIRSWALHGGAPGKAWASGTVKEAVEKGLVPEDPIVELLTLQPDEVYARFSLGAWRYEYDLDPDKAARFVETYMRATGQPLDLTRAFGASASTVGNAVYRRYHAPNPFQSLFKAMMVRDYEYRQAAHEDLEYARSLIPAEDRLLTEALSKQVFTTMSAQHAALLVWPSFLGYVILASEAPDLLVDLNKSSKKPPDSDDKPLSYTQYHDAINTYISYFHPSGARYIDPSGDEDFAMLPENAWAMMWRAYYKKPIYTRQVKDLLMSMWQWLKQHKLSGPIFHKLIADWRKKNWKGILDQIPEKSDVRSAFEKFAQLNPLPKDGVSLAQTAVEPEDKTDASVELGVKTQNLNPMPVSKTDAGTMALKKGTPIGIGSLIQLPLDPPFWKVVGAFDLKKTEYNPTFVLKSLPGGGVTTYTDQALANMLDTNNAKVLQGNYQLPGTKYAAPDEVPDPADEQPSEEPAATDDAMWELVKADFPEYWDKFKLMNLSDTLTSDTMEDFYGLTLVTGEVLIDKQGNGFKFLRAYQTPSGPILIVLSPDNELVWYEDAEIAEIVEKGTVTFQSQEGIETKEPPTKKVPLPPVPSYVPQHEVGTIYEESGVKCRILAVVGETYVVQRLSVPLSGQGTEVQLLPALQVDAKIKQVFPAEFLDEYVVAEGLSEAADDPPAISKGSAFNFDGDPAEYIRSFYSSQGDMRFALVSVPATTDIHGVTVGYDDYVLVTYTKLQKLVKPTYAPTGPAPESGAEDVMDVPDAEQGNPEMSGTQAALDWVSKMGWTHAVKSESPLFQWSLGAKLQYGTDTRAIIGYCFVKGAKGKLEDGQSCYVILTGSGKVNYKTCEQGNTKYGPLIEMLQSVVDGLKPKPGVEPSKFPKLNYVLSTEAKAVAKAKNLIYVPSPKWAAFTVGTKLIEKNTKNVFRLIGWVQAEGQTEPHAVLKPPGTVNLKTANGTALKYGYAIVYKHHSELNVKSKEVTCGKSDIDAVYEFGLPSGEHFPSALDDGWTDPNPVKQPAMAVLPSSGKHVSAGIVAVLPPGTQLTADGVNVMPHTYLLMTHPTNDYGGYSITFPKGTVEPGESIEHAAVREVYEETGLAVVPVAFLGDFMGNQSVTRFFIGYITSGDPKKAGSETDAITFKPVGLDKWDAFPWASSLKPRDKEVAAAAFEWLKKNGQPGDFVGEQASTHTAVTGPQDVEGQTGPQTYDPSFQFSPPKAGPKHIVAPIDYVVDGPTLSYTDQLAQKTSPPVDTWQFQKQSLYYEKGYPPVGGQSYPPVGVKFKFAAQGVSMLESYTGVYTVKAYALFNHEQPGAIKTGVRMVFATGPADLDYVVLKHNDDFLLQPAHFAPPEEPAPAVKPKVETIPANTQYEDMWATLVNSSIPVTQAMLNVWRSMVEDEGSAVSVVVSDTANIPGFPAWQEPFTHMTTGNDIQICLGYLRASFTDGKEQVFCCAKSGTKLSVFYADFSDRELYTSLGALGTTPPAWFVHPDPADQALIESVAKSGLKAAGLTTQSFKKKLKQAGFPYVQQITQQDVPFVASLFMPGTPDAVQEQIVGKLALKAKGHGKAKKSKLAKAPKPVVPAEPVPTVPGAAPSAPPEMKIVAKADDYNSAMKIQTVSNPDPKGFFDTGKSVGGGSNPSKILTNIAGDTWFFKMSKEGDASPIRAQAEAAAYKLMSALDHDEAVPVGVMQYQGKWGSLQPLIDAENVGNDPGGLSDDDKARVLTQHMIDMYMGDHDGFPANWMRMKDGRLVAVDRGQAFKFLLQGKPESLDPYWNAPGNVNAGQVYGKKLLKDWAEGKTAIPDKAWKAARQMIARIQKLPESALNGILKPLFETLQMPDTKQESVQKAALKRQKNYLKDWTTVLTKLDKTFKWPDIGPVTLSLDVGVSDYDPAKAGFGKVEAKEIKRAAEIPIKGRMIRVDRDAIEGQEVIVKKVFRKKGGKLIPATMINFRVARHAGLDAGRKIMKEHGALMKSYKGAVVPQDMLLAVDKLNGFWPKIEGAVKTLNHHLAPATESNNPSGPDGKPNEKTLKACFDIVLPLEKLLQQTASSEGTYKETGEPNSAVHAMCVTYLNYINFVIKPITDDIQGHMNSHSSHLGPYVYTPPAEKAEPHDNPKNVMYQSVKPYAGGARLPELVQENGQLVVKSLEGAIFNPSKQPFASVTGKNNAVVEIMFPGPGIPELNSGMEGYKGMCWGIVDGEPSNATVAYLLKLFEDATGLTMKAATPKDKEIHFWVKQAYVLQGTSGVVNPASSGQTLGVGIQDADFGSALEKYKKGKDDEALADLKEMVASKLKKPLSELEKQAAKMIDGKYADDGSGYAHIERLGWTKKSLADYLGKNFRVVHRLGMGVSQFLSTLKDAPVLYAQNMRSYHGYVHVSHDPKYGGSPECDVNAGGTQGCFACFRSGKIGQSDVLYFDQSLLLRVDIMAIEGGDTYGNVTYPRAVRPEAWKGHGGTGSVGLSSPFQVNIRHGVDLPTYLWEAACGSSSERDKCIKICKEKGWTSFAGGRTPEQVFTAK